MKLKELKDASSNIDEFCSKLGAVITYSNNKGDYIGRMTSKGVQIFVVTGKSFLECMINASIKVSEKRKTLGV